MRLHTVASAIAARSRSAAVAAVLVLLPPVILIADDGASQWHPAVDGACTHAVLKRQHDAVWRTSTSPRRLPRRIRKAVTKAAEGTFLEPARTLVVDYPLNDTVFPPDFAPPTFVWHDGALGSDTWLIDMRLGAPEGRICVLAPGNASVAWNTEGDVALSEEAKAFLSPAYDRCELRWRPDPALWKSIQNASSSGPVTIRIRGLRGDSPGQLLSEGTVTFTTSKDLVGAPIFYREVPLPFIYASANLGMIRWQLADVTSLNPPRTLLTNMDLCGNCHSFSADGKTLAMDVDYGADKGSYLVTPIRKATRMRSDDVISWSDYRAEDGELTFGLLAQISPDGRHVISTVKDRSVFSPVPDFWYSQRFFPIKGILCRYDREAKTFSSLPGADDPAYVQSNPCWSPDCRIILFARAEAYDLMNLKNPESAIIKREEASEFFEGGKRFRYDIYSVPFNNGAGGTATPLPGASGDGKSNYFPRYSPDGKWVVFCKAAHFMLLQPDSMLHIVPATGGTPRVMRCNHPGKMNSWHSWSPNGRWLVFSSKIRGPFTQLWLTHVDENGNDAPAVLLERLTCRTRGANIPEFLNADFSALECLEQSFGDYHKMYRQGVHHQGWLRHAEAARAFRQALAINPEHAESWRRLAMCLDATGRASEAIDAVQNATRLAPDNAAGQRLAGHLMMRARRYPEGLKALAEVWRLEPTDLANGNALAWVLAAIPDPELRDPERALQIARKVVAASSSPPVPFLDTLATAYAATGRYKEAAETLEHALGVSPGAPLTGSGRTAAHQRLLLYRASRPFLDPRFKQP